MCLIIKLITHNITIKFAMDNPIWSSPLREGEQGDWGTPARRVVRVKVHEGKGDRQIARERGIPRSTVGNIRLAKSSRRPHKTKGFHQRMMNVREIVARFDISHQITARVALPSSKSKPPSASKLLQEPSAVSCAKLIIDVA